MLSSPEAYRMVHNYFQLFGDYEEAWHPTIITIDVFETHVSVILDCLFQMCISGEFGGGKTAILEAAKEIAYHGTLANSVSGPARARIANRFRNSWFCDEFDKTENDEDGFGYVMARVGYRRGNLYVRWDAEQDEPDISEPFAPINYTVHEEVEKALTTRRLADITISKSMDYRVPAINTLRARYSRQIAEKLWFWRLEFLRSWLTEHTGEIDDATQDYTTELLNEKVDIAKIRDRLWKNATTELTVKGQRLLRLLKGRENELSYVALKLESFLKLDIVESLIETINQKRVADIALTDSRLGKFIELLKMAVDNGKTSILLKEITDELHAWCVTMKHNKPRTRTLNAYQKQVGFRENVNKKATRKGVELIFDEKVKERIKSLSELEVQEIKKEELEKSTLDSEL